MTTIFESRSGRSGPSYVEDYQRGFSLAGFQLLREEVAAEVLADPVQFQKTMSTELGVAPAEAAAHIRDLLQDHFNHVSVRLPVREVTTGEGR